MSTHGRRSELVLQGTDCRRSLPMDNGRPHGGPGTRRGSARREQQRERPLRPGMVRTPPAAPGRPPRRSVCVAAGRAESQPGRRFLAESCAGLGRRGGQVAVVGQGDPGPAALGLNAGWAFSPHAPPVGQWLRYGRSQVPWRVAKGASSRTCLTAGDERRPSPSDRRRPSTDRGHHQVAQRVRPGPRPHTGCCLSPARRIWRSAAAGDPR